MNDSAAQLEAIADSGCAFFARNRVMSEMGPVPASLLADLALWITDIRVRCLATNSTIGQNCLL
jgi:hypothetical protein